MNCGSYYDNCGRPVYCGGCSWPSFCGGGGYNVCGAPPEGNCGPNWPSMGTFWCDGGRQYQRICGCYPLGYQDSNLWVHESDDCYSHMTGNGC